MEAVARAAKLDDDDPQVMDAKLLLVEDDADQRELLSELLAGQSYEVRTARDLASAETHLSQEVFDAVLTDLRLGKDDGLRLCQRAHELQSGVPVIVFTGHGSLHLAIEAIRAGAYDFLTKPVDAQLLEVSVRRAVELRRVKNQLNELTVAAQKKKPGEILGQCPPMLRVYDLIGRVADTPASVLVCGESGTGKELVARALHQGGERKHQPFVAINCAAVPSSLLEAELFGHEKGAFTDARRARDGLFVQAQGGTLFLDEIGEMPEEMQVKLLRVLQERKVRPVGAAQEVDIDVRIVAATHRDLEEGIEEGRFREDLYYRLNVVQIDLPPLRARGNDILLLASRFVEEASERLGRQMRGISPEAADKLLVFDWPGNVRQLQNCIERAVTLARFDQVTVEDLPEKIRGYEARAESQGIALDPEHIYPLEVMERIYVARVIDVVGGNKSQAARVLGVDRKTLYRKLEAYQQGGNKEARDEGGASEK